MELYARSFVVGETLIERKGPEADRGQDATVNRTGEARTGLSCRLNYAPYKTHITSGTPGLAAAAVAM